MQSKPSVNRLRWTWEWPLFTPPKSPAPRAPTGMPGQRAGSRLRIGLLVMFPERVCRGLQDLVFGCRDVEAENIDDPIGQMLRQLVAQHRNDDFISRQHDLLDAVVAHHPFQGVDEFLCVMQVVVFNVALVARLRPAADRTATDLGARHLIASHRGPASEHEQARGVRVGNQRGVRGMLVSQPGERVQVRPIGDIQAMFLNWRVELHGLEEAIGAGARKQRHAISGGA